MKVFISWSKPLSRSVAESFADWLPKVIQECRNPYVSTETDKGEAWFQAITQELQAAKVGIVFITPENAREEWIHYEAGALYAALDKALLPVLVGMSKTDYDGPLKNIQMTEMSDRADMLKLMRTLNKHLEDSLSEGVLEDAFAKRWEELEEAVADAIKRIDHRPTKERTIEDKIDEILLLVRESGRQATSVSLAGAKGAKYIKSSTSDIHEAILRDKGKFVFRNGVFLGELDAVFHVDNHLVVSYLDPKGTRRVVGLNEVNFSNAPF